MRVPSSIITFALALPFLSVPFLSVPGEAQRTPATPAAAAAPTAIPALVPFSGVAIGGDGKALTGEIGMTFLIYKDEQGGEPLWVETQTVAPDSAGHYQVQLGAANLNGLPSGLFATGEARWLEIQIAGEKPQARVLLASVPYALKAADAATLGGLPASAFALAGSNAAINNAGASGVTPNASSTVTTPGGTSGYIPKFTGASTIADSPVFVSGSNVGIGTTTPAQTLDVNGTSVFRNSVYVYHNGTATPSSGVNSVPLLFLTEGYNSRTKAPVAMDFYWKAEIAGNNTAAPSSTLNLLYSPGTGAVETGFHFNPNGTITFAPGQTFNGSSAAGIGVVGNSTNGSGVQGISSTSYGVEGSSTSAPGVLGYTFGGTLNTAGVVGQAGQTSGYGGIAGVWGDSFSHVGVLGTSYQQDGVQGISEDNDGVQGQSTSGYGVEGNSSSGSGVVGTSNTANGVVGSTGGNSLYTAGVLGWAGSRTSYDGIAGVWGDSGNHVGVYGSSTQYAGVFGQSTNGVGIQGSSTSASGVYGYSSNTSGIHGETASASGGDAAVYGGSDSGAAGVIGVSNSGYGVYGVSHASSGSNIAGVYGYSAGQVPAVAGNNTGAGMAGYFTSASPSVATLTAINAGVSNGTATAVLGVGGSEAGIGVEGQTIGGIAVLGAVGLSAPGNRLSGYAGNVALWGDSTISDGVAVMGSASDSNAAFLTNNSDSATTIYVKNYGSGGTGQSVSPFGALEAATPKGSCGFGGNGDLTCTGQVKALATIGNGARTVETYSMQSPENWMEDFGSGSLTNGLATVALDAAFAETVIADTDYHVFLTPQGDSKGLYVINKTATSFEVHESGGGRSTIAFDYRIVAKRRGFETQRMADVTETMKAVRARDDSQAARFKKAAK